MTAPTSTFQQQIDRLKQLQRYDEAIALLEQELETNPQSVGDYWQLGLLYLLQDRELEAQATWMLPLTEGSEDESACRLRDLTTFLESEAQHCERHRDWQFAWVLRQYVREFDPENLPNILALVGLTLEQTEDVTVALADFPTHYAERGWQQIPDAELTGLLQLLPRLAGMAPLHPFLTTCAQQLAQSEEPRLVPLKSRLGNALNLAGMTFLEQEHLEDALQCFQTLELLVSAAVPSDRAVAGYNLGFTLYKLGRYAEATVAFERSLIYNPDYIPARDRLAMARYKTAIAAQPFQFTQDWFSRNIPIWQEHLQRFAGQPDLQFLEIGSWEGESTCWLLANLLVHPTARITCIDSFAGESYLQLPSDYLQRLESRFDANIATAGGADKVQKIVGMSQEALRSLPFDFYDLVYIDGSHLACDVLVDAALSWDLVKVGGILIFDDYDKQFPDNPQQNPRVGVDAFLACFGHKVRVLHQSYQVIVAKSHR